MRKWIWLALIIVLIGCTSEEEQVTEERTLDELLGQWHGAIEVPNMPLEIQLTFEEDDENEEIVGFIDIPAQGIDQYPLSELELEEEQVRFKMDIPGQFVEFVSDLPHDDTLTGEFSQQGHTFDFELERGELETEPEQASDDINWLTISSDIGDLKGELLQPNSEQTDRVALLIPGSGPVNRDGNSAGTESDTLKLLAESLAEQGTASLRYSKRGVGENQEATIPEEEMTLERMSEDAVAWVERLNEDYEQVIIIGHSQGALVGQLAALQTQVDGFVSLAGAGRTIDDVLNDQLSSQLPQEFEEEAQSILNQLREGELVEEEEISSELYSIFRPTIQPFLMSWMSYDPAELMTQMNIPSLIIQGTHDRQVFEEDAEQLAEANNQAELVMVEGMDHVLKQSDSVEDTLNYQDPEQPLADELLTAIEQYIQNLSQNDNS
ncbi:alpha/beta hydrolase [Alkalibacillus salilacus]|uniref:Pimeloyl-ACP methyl ester carboxylesterase n=1 Tax=Alkalibacillus salilacus TaxID=284582 RepID=A0ABT9VEF2_9BACI|nr:alpha/beta fold hydrolase [Alkalibacillus salilacus]MDQ0159351.1 pimeloyl-ACP methyl ester carboxylesterase [Alkalibacillus salilacus]